MSVYSMIMEKVRREKVHMTLIDPASQDPVASGSIAREAESAGSDFILVGGSTDVSGELMQKTIDEIKARCSLKTIIFPGSPNMLSANADALYFMSLLNSKDLDFVIGHQVRSSRLIHELGIESISMGYVVFSPGMRVGRVGNADLVERDDRDTALSYALTAEMLGFKLVYFESGSGSNTYVSPDVIAHTKRYITVPLIVGGGIRTPESSMEIARAGADIIVTGTVAERSSDVFGTLRPIIKAIKSI